MSYGVMLLIFIGISMWQSHIADNDKRIKIAVSEDIRLPDHERFTISYFTADKLPSMQQIVGEQLDAVVYIEADKVIIFIAEKDKWRRVEALQRLRIFLDRYRQAFAMLRAGFRDVVFPPGTYQLRLNAAVACATQ